MAKKYFEISGLTAELTTTGILTLEGEGKIPDFTDAFAPWFKDRKKIKRVIVGPYIDYVGENTFEGSLNLEDIVIMNKETMVNKNAFNGCNSVKNVLAKKEVRDLFFTEADYTYYSLNLKNSTLKVSQKNDTIIYINEFPKNIDDLEPEEIDMGTYYRSPLKEKFTMIETSYNNVRVGTDAEFLVFGDIKEILMPFSYISYLKRIFIPNTISKIERGTFAWNKKLKIIEFAKDSIIKSLPQSCFLGVATKKIVIPSSVTEIENGCFSYSKLEEITFSSPVRLGDYVFQSDKALTTINGSDNIIELGNSTFQGCIYLSELNGGLSKELKTIPKSCFRMASSSEVIRCIEDSNVECIEDGAFVETTSKSFVAPPTLKEIGKEAFLISRLKYVDLSRCRIEAIKSATFASSTALETIKLPDTVTKINARAFYGCRNIKDLELNDNLRTIGPSAFTNLLCTLKVPKALKNWGSFAVLNDQSLYNIDFSENDNFIVENGIIYDKKKTKILGTTPDFSKDDKNIVIPSSVKSLKGLYDYESDHVMITFPSSIESFPVDEIRLRNCDIKIQSLKKTAGIIWLSCKTLYIPKKYKDLKTLEFSSIVKFY